MSNIKPTGTNASSPVDPLGDAAPAATTATTAPATNAPGTSSAAAVASPSETVVSALREGKVTPDEAVRQLTDIAIQRAGVPASMRPQIESRMRDLLGSDPTLGGLLRRMGASLPDE